MDPAAAIDELRKALSELRANGRQQISVDALESYLLHADSSASKADDPYRQLTHDSQLAEYDATIKIGLENFRGVLEASKEAINAALLVNGGAVVAILSFLGAIVTKAPSLNRDFGSALTLILLSFTMGVLAGAMAFGARYIAQYYYARDREKAGNRSRGVAIILILLSYIAFACGSIGAYLAFGKYINW